MIAALSLSFALFVGDPCVPPAPFRMPAAPPALLAKPNPRRRWPDRALVAA